MEVLLTGASGFIGSHTIQRFEAEHPRTFKGDITNMSDWEVNLTGGEVVMAIAGIRSETPSDFTVNGLGIEALFKAATGTNKLPKKLVLASSQAVYMGNKTPFRESDGVWSTTVYGQSKLLAERSALEWCEKLDIPCVILRYSTVLGAGIREKSNMSGPLFVWTKAALNNEPIRVFQDGQQSRDYIHIDDVVAANLMAMEALKPGIYNVGGGIPIEVRELADWIKEFSHSSSEIQILGGEPSVDDPREMFSDISKLCSFGWEPKKTTKEAVAEFIA